jgi:hypothetical protein
VFWVYALLQQGRSAGIVTPWMLAVEPDLLGRVIVRINEVGAWSLGGHVGSSGGSHDAVKGSFLWLIWLAEAGTVVGFSVVITVKMGSALPYCEACGRWCPAGKRILRTGPGDRAEVRRRLEARDFEVMRQLPPSPEGAPAWFSFVLHQCDNCGGLSALSVLDTRTVVNRKGKAQTKVDAFVDKLLLSGDEAQQVKAMKEPPAPAPAEQAHTTTDEVALPLPPESQPASESEAPQPPASEPQPRARPSSPPSSWI